MIPGLTVPGNPIRTVTIYRVADGAVLRGYHGPCPDEQCQPGESFIEGAYPAICFTVDHANKRAVEFTPPDREGMLWDADMRMHRITDAMRAILKAKADIVDLEAAQPRIIRERDLGDMTLVEARQRLRDVDDQIKALRAIIQANS